MLPDTSKGGHLNHPYSIHSWRMVKLDLQAVAIRDEFLISGNNSNALNSNG